MILYDTALTEAPTHRHGTLPAHQVVWRSSGRQHPAAHHRPLAGKRRHPRPQRRQPIRRLTRHRTRCDAKPQRWPPRASPAPPEMPSSKAPSPAMAASPTPARCASPAMPNSTSPAPSPTPACFDIMTWQGTLPASFVNNGTVIDRSAVKVSIPRHIRRRFHALHPGLRRPQLSTPALGKLVRRLAKHRPGPAREQRAIGFHRSRGASPDRRFYRILVAP